MADETAQVVLADQDSSGLGDGLILRDQPAFRSQADAAPTPQPISSTPLLVAANLAPVGNSLGSVAGAIPAASVITVSAAFVPTPAQSGGSQPAQTHGGSGIVATDQIAAQPAANANTSQPDAAQPNAAIPGPIAVNPIRPMTAQPHHDAQSHRPTAMSMMRGESNVGTSGGTSTNGGGGTMSGGGGSPDTGGGYYGTGGGYYGTGGGYYGTGGGYYGTGGGYYGTGGGYYLTSNTPYGTGGIYSTTGADYGGTSGGYSPVSGGSSSTGGAYYTTGGGYYTPAIPSNTAGGSTSNSSRVANSASGGGNQPINGSGGTQPDAFTLHLSGGGSYTSSGNFDDIGAQCTAVVQETSGSGITKIDWSVNGALVNILATADQGTTEVPLPVPDDFASPNGATAEYLNFDWGNDAGQQEVQANVFFADGGNIEEEVADNIVAPKVNSFTRTYQPLQINTIKATDNGASDIVPTLTQGIYNITTKKYTTDGDAFNVSVSGVGANGKALPQGGTIFLEQTAWVQDILKYTAAIPGVNPPRNSFLFCNSSMVAPFQADLVNYMLDGPPIEFTNTIVNVAPGPLNQTLSTGDNPATLFPSSSYDSYSAKDPYVYIVMQNKKFVTTLMFKPNNGVALPLQNMSWAVMGTMTFNTKITPSGIANTDKINLLNVKNWTLTNVSPAKAGQQNGQQTTADPKYKGHTQNNGANDPSTLRSFTVDV